MYNKCLLFIVNNCLSLINKFIKIINTIKYFDYFFSDFRNYFVYIVKGLIIYYKHISFRIT